jgi:hypothetical protein
MILGLAPVLAAISGGANAAAPAWKVSETSGEVRLVENGRARPATKGALLTSGSTIATGPGARAVIVRGEEFVVISPRSQLRVPAESSSNGIMQLIEDFGTALFKIQKKSTPHFGVQTPYLAAVVKGTTFSVTVGPEGSSVQVTEGAVQVSTLDGGAAELVRAGTIATVGASDLFRLTVDGEKTKVVQSPNGPPAEVAAKSGPPAHSAAYSGPRGQEVRVSQRLDEDSKSLSKLTKGLVDGNSAHEMATAEFREQAKAARKEGSNPGNGDGAGGGKPDEAGKPDKPSDPGKPDNGSKPGEPAKPEKPEDPAKPDKDPKPEDPVKPGQPEDPAQPGKDPKAENPKAEDPKQEDPKPDAGGEPKGPKPDAPSNPDDDGSGKDGKDSDTDGAKGDGKDADEKDGKDDGHQGDAKSGDDGIEKDGGDKADDDDVEKDGSGDKAGDDADDDSGKDSKKED